MVRSPDKYPLQQTFSILLDNLLRKHGKLPMHRYNYFRGFPWVHAWISTLNLYTLDLYAQGKMDICSSAHVHWFSICYFLQCTGNRQNFRTYSDFFFLAMTPATGNNLIFQEYTDFFFLTVAAATGNRQNFKEYSQIIFSTVTPATGNKLIFREYTGFFFLTVAPATGNRQNFRAYSDFFFLTVTAATGNKLIFQEYTDFFS